MLKTCEIVRNANIVIVDTVQILQVVWVVKCVKYMMFILNVFVNVLRFIMAKIVPIL